MGSSAGLNPDPLTDPDEPPDLDPDTSPSDPDPSDSVADPVDLSSCVSWLLVGTKAFSTSDVDNDDDGDDDNDDEVTDVDSWGARDWIQGRIRSDLMPQALLYTLKKKILLSKTSKWLEMLIDNAVAYTMQNNLILLLLKHHSFFISKYRFGNCVRYTLSKAPYNEYWISSLS